MINLKFNILQILKGEEGLTFLELKKQLEEKNLKFSWKELKLALINLEEKHLIEERHFKDGKVDYSLEPEGYKYLKTK